MQILNRSATNEADCFSNEEVQARERVECNWFDGNFLASLIEEVPMQLGLAVAIVVPQQVDAWFPAQPRMVAIPLPSDHELIPDTGRGGEPFVDSNQHGIGALDTSAQVHPRDFAGGTPDFAEAEVVAVD
jgi:hypothetical protein